MNTEKPEQSEIKLTRTDKRPLVFLGHEIASDSTKDHNSTRWTKCGVYETEAGKIVVGIGYITCWQGEKDRHTAEVFADREAALTYIEEHAAGLASDLADRMGVSERI